jgi:hypothetical protein
MARETYFQWPYSLEYAVAGAPPTDAIPCYVVPITIAWKPGMRLDFRDLRFRDENLTPCRFRLESYTAGSSATFLIGIWPHQTRLSVLYGNGAAASASDATFCPVLDEFAGAAVDASIWTDLVPGENRIGMTLSEEASRATMTIAWYNRYLGA